MNKFTLLIALLGSLCLFSCKKEHNAAPGTTTTTTSTTDKKYPVSFNVSADFTQSITTIHSLASKGTGKVLATSQDTLKQNLTLLYYLVFKNDGTFVHQLTQKASDANFGSVTDTLPSGQYQIIFAGSLTDQLNVLDYGNITPRVLPHYYMVYNSASLDDWLHTYYKLYNITVGTTSQQQKLTLDRVGGELQVNILDAVPASIATIKIRFSYNEIYDFPGNGFSAINNYVQTDAVTADQRTSGYTWEDDNIPGGTQSDVYIEAYDSTGKILNSVTVPGVTITGGKKTILSGNLFTGNGGGSTFQLQTQPFGGTSSTINFNKASK